MKEEAMATRASLLESALDIMSEKPFASVSMTEIARRVDLSKGALYWHFRNKHDLLVGVVENMHAKIQAELATSLASLESAGELRTYYREQLEKSARSEQFRKMHRLMLRREEWPRELRERVLDIVKGHLEQERCMIGRLLEGARDEERIRKDIPPRDLSILITAIFHGIFIFQVSDFFHFDFSRYTDFIFDAIEKELRPGGSADEKTDRKGRVAEQ